MDVNNMTYEEKANLAENPNTPLDILRKLTKNKSWLIRYYVAKNPKTSSNLLVMLFEYEKNLREPDSDTIKALYRNKNLPTFAKRVIETLFGDIVK